MARGPGPRSRGQPARWPHGRAELAPRPDGGDPALDEHDDPVGLGQRRALGGRADDGRRRAAQRRPELDLGGGVERRGDVVGQQQLGVAGERAGQREPLHLAAGEPDAAVADERVGAAGLLDVAAPAGRVARAGLDLAGRRGRAATLSAKVPDSTRGTWATWATRPGRRNDLRVGDRRGRSSASRRCGRPARPAPRAGWTCPSRPGRAAAPARRASTVRSTSLTPMVPSSWTAVRPTQLEACAAGRAAPGRGAGPCRAPGRRPAGRSIRSPPPASRLVACIQARVPGASVMTEPATRPNQSKPLTAPATSSAVARPQPPREVAPPRRRRRRTGPSRSARRRAAPARGARARRRRPGRRRPGAGGACTLRRRGGELDRAHRVERRDQGPAEAGPGRGRTRPPSGRRPGGRGSRPAPRPPSRRAGRAPASRLVPAISAVTDDDGQAVDEVDPAVGVARQPVGVHGAGDDLAGRRARQPVLRGLAGEHRGADPEHHRDPPARVAAERLGEQQRRRRAARPPGRRSASRGCRRPAGRRRGGPRSSR